VSVSLSLSLQVAASVGTIISSWAYGNKKTAGPLIGLLSQFPWWGLMVLEGLYGLLPVNAAMTFLHTRNLIKWKREQA
jgi:hypothetical protein